MDARLNCPCDAVKELQSTVNRHEERISATATSIAVVNTKINIILGILGATGVAVLGVLVKMLFDV